jgi:hypothetical protein
MPPSEVSAGIACGLPASSKDAGVLARKLGHRIMIGTDFSASVVPAAESLGSCSPLRGRHPKCPAVVAP